MKKCGPIRKFFGLCGKKRSKVGGQYDTAKDFRKGDAVSISAVQFFGHHGEVEKVGKKLVHVRVNLLNKVYKFDPQHLRNLY